MIIWEGPSQLDGSPIQVLATGVPKAGSRARSGNSKTGDMIQISIARADVLPTAALKLGLDGAQCGGCPFRSKPAGGDGGCYTHKNLRRGFAQNGTFKAHRDSGSVPFDLERFRGQLVRFGSYGDPAAVPFEVWEPIAEVAEGFTGYTHQWRTAHPNFAKICMASVDSIVEAAQAMAQGYRVFFVRSADEAKPKGMITCPASAEAGKKIQCDECLMCGGTSADQPRSITIIRH